MNKVLIIDLNFEKNSIFKKEFVEPIENILIKKNMKYEIKHFTEIKKISQFSHIILSGVALKDFEYEKNFSKFNWVLDLNIPILGICAGGQVIVENFNQKIINNKEIGLYKLDKIKEDEILKDISFPVEVYSLHNKSFGEISCFITLLANNYNQLIKHEFKNIYACAFHPEVRNHKIIENFLEIK